MSQQHPNEAIKAKLCIYFQEIAHIMFKPQEPNNPHFIQIIALLQIMVKSGGCVCVCVCVCVRVCVRVCQHSQLSRGISFIFWHIKLWWLSVSSVLLRDSSCSDTLPAAGIEPVTSELQNDLSLTVKAVQSIRYFRPRCQYWRRHITSCHTYKGTV